MTVDELVKEVANLTARIEQLETQTTSGENKLYSVSEVAKMLGLTREAVYYMIRRGELPTIKLGTIKVRQSDLNRIVTGT